MSPHSDRYHDHSGMVWLIKVVVSPPPHPPFRQGKASKGASEPPPFWQGVASKGASEPPILAVCGK